MSSARQIKKVERHLSGTSYTLSCGHERFHGGPLPAWLIEGACRPLPSRTRRGSPAINPSRRSQLNGGDLAS